MVPNNFITIFKMSTFLVTPSRFANLRIFAFFFMLGTGFFGEHTVQGNPILRSVELENDTLKRFFSLMLLNLPKERGVDADLIKLAHEGGMNAVYLTIPWNYVYLNSPTETPNWDKYDEQIEIASSLGMKIALRIHLGRHNSGLKGFWELKDSPHDGRNTPLLAGYGDTYFRFNYDPALQLAIAFVQEVTKRYQFLQDQNKLLFISVTNTSEQEAGYNTQGYYQDKQVPSLYDYSPQVIEGFQAWLQSNYGKIERLNSKWNRSYKSFKEAYPPYAPWEPFESFRDRYGKDWYIYRHLHLKTFIEKMIGAVKSVDSTIKYVADYGSVFDGMSALRGTLGFKDLNEKTDGIKVNDDLSGSDHRFSVDILRSQSPARFFVANEVFAADWAENFEFTKQTDENFQHGADMVAFLVSTIPKMQKSMPFIRDASARWLSSSIAPITYADTVSYLLSEAVEKGSATRVVYDLYKAKAYADSKKPKPVYINLKEDLFTDEYWVNASNKKPFVAAPLETRTIAVNRSFKFKIPDSTFRDSDGRMARIEASGLPSWLTFNEGYLAGTPSTLGNFSVTVTGFEGGAVSTQLAINVVVPYLKIKLVGNGDEQLLTLAGGEVLAFESLPSLINITATSNFDFETIYYDLKGPYGKKSTSSQEPYSLIKSHAGFPPFVGRYLLNARTESNGVTTVSRSVSFAISYGDSLAIAKNIDAWQFYPNPVESVLNIKLPDKFSTNDLDFVLTDISGRSVRLVAPQITIADQLVHIDLTASGIAVGTYILQLKRGKTLVKQFRFLKAPAIK